MNLLLTNFLVKIILYYEKFMIGDWGLGIGDWGLGIGPNPQSPKMKMKINIQKIKKIFYF